MLYDQDTIEHHRKERPGFRTRNMGGASLEQVGPALQKSLDMSPIKPEKDAISFYLLNHAMAEISKRVQPDEPLGDMQELVELYSETVSKAGYRLWNYLVCITTRESRHLTGSQENHLKGEYGSEAVKITQEAKSHAQAALFESDSKLSLGHYLDYLVAVFDDLSWSSSYGGPAWGTVTKCIRDCVKGVTTIEQMLDVGYTLAHNNGPIFNKGMHYQHYDGQSMLKILDCQRAGQVPQLVKSSAVSQVTSGHVNILERMEALIPGFQVEPWVNWHLVEQLGSVGSYSHEKANVKAHFGNTPAYKEIMADVEAAVEAKKKAEKEAKTLAEKQYFEVMPGTKVKKERKQR